MNNKNPTMNAHLIPNNAFLNFKPNKLANQPQNEHDYDEGTLEENISIPNNDLEPTHSSNDPKINKKI